MVLRNTFGRREVGGPILDELLDARLERTLGEVEVVDCADTHEVRSREAGPLTVHDGAARLAKGRHHVIAGRRSVTLAKRRQVVLAAVPLERLLADAKGGRAHHRRGKLGTVVAMADERGLYALDRLITRRV